VTAADSIFGLDRAIVGDLIAGASVEKTPTEPRIVTERFARAAWSSIVEPADGDAGSLVQTLGAVAALTAIVERYSSDTILGALRERDVLVADNLSGRLPDALQRWSPRLKSATVMRALKRAAEVGAVLLSPDESVWPSGFADLGEHAPLALWRRGGEPAGSFERSIAIVGARAATGYGEHVTMELAAGLVDRGLTIVSGAAYGVDGMAHRAALASAGTTIAFLAGGVDRFYPAGHDSLLHKIVGSGAVFSELPCGADPTRWRFLQRNRLIAASSGATIVVEAGRRSGSLNTAGHAASMGRPLGAVPGPITSPASAGCHRLIREYGADCITNVDEALELVGIESDPVGDERTSPEQRRVLDALSARTPRSVAEVAEAAGLSIGGVTAALGLLELDQAVEERETGWVAASRSR
jgi:DNA processing protein